VLAFLSVQAIFAGGGLNTASRLLATLIAQHHPAIKRLFAKGPRVIGGMLKIDAPMFETDGWHARVDVDSDWPSKCLPLPVVPATQEILGLGNVSLILWHFSHLYNRRV
jgi:hypothetical protein